MIRYRCYLVVILLFTGLAFITFVQNVLAQTPTPVPVVRAVLFLRNTCGYCQKIVAEIIPPLYKKYSNQLQIFGIDVSLPEGDALYGAAIERFSIEYIGVPTLIVGNHILIGAVNIEQRFPGLIEEYLSQGGMDWPDIPGLAEVLAAAQSTSNPTPAGFMPDIQVTIPAPPFTAGAPIPIPGLLLVGEHSSGLEANFARDPLGNSLAVVTFVGMLLSVGGVAVFFRRTSGVPLTRPWAWIIPALCIVGFGVAGYLAYVESAEVTAVCGPIGDCITVQQSKYARLFGILPIGALGMAGYIMILLAWVVGRFCNGKLADYGSIFLLGMTAFGTLFSMYLTFLEPFVIGATCAWCLTSAILMTILLWLSIRPVKYALFNLFHS